MAQQRTVDVVLNPSGGAWAQLESYKKGFSIPITLDSEKLITQWKAFQTGLITKPIVIQLDVSQAQSKINELKSQLQNMSFSLKFNLSGLKTEINQVVSSAMGSPSNPIKLIVDPQPRVFRQGDPRYTGSGGSSSGLPSLASGGSNRSTIGEFTVDNGRNAEILRLQQARTELEKQLGQYRLNQGLGRSNAGLIQGVALRNNVDARELEGSFHPKFFDPSRLGNVDTSRQVLIGGLSAGLPGLLAGAAGGAIAGGPGALAGVLAVQTAGVAIGAVLRPLAEELHAAAEAGLTLQKSVQGVAAILQESSQISGVGGIVNQVAAQQARAKDILTQVRSQLLPIGVSGEAAAAIGQSVVSSTAQRGFQLNASQVADVSGKLGAAASLLTPDILQNTTRLRRDISDIVIGGPNASRTSLGVQLKPEIEKIREAKTPEEFVHALDSLGKLKEALEKSGEAALSYQRILGAIDNAQTQLGDGLLTALKPGLDDLAKTLSDPDVADNLKDLGHNLGTLGSGLIFLGSSIAGIIRILTTVPKEPGHNLALYLQKLFPDLPIVSPTVNQGTTTPTSEAKLKGVLEKSGITDTDIEPTIKKLSTTNDEKVKAISEGLNGAFGTSAYSNRAGVLESFQSSLRSKANEEFKSRLEITGPGGKASIAPIELENARNEQSIISEQSSGRQGRQESAKKQADTALKEFRKSLLQYDTSTGLRTESQEAAITKAQDDLKSAREEVLKVQKLQTDEQNRLTKAVTEESNALGKESEVRKENLSLSQAAVIGTGPSADISRTALSLADIPKERASLQSRIEALENEISGGSLSSKEVQVRQIQIDNFKNQQATLPSQTFSENQRQENSEVEKFTLNSGLIKSAEALADAFFNIKQHTAELGDELTNANRALEDFSSNAKIANLSGNDKLLELGKQIEAAHGQLPFVSGEGITAETTRGLLGGKDEDPFGQNQHVRLLQTQYEQQAKELARGAEDNAPFGRAEQALGRRQENIQREIDISPRAIRDAEEAYITSQIAIRQKLDEGSGAVINFAKALENVTNILNKYGGGSPLYANTSSDTPKGGSGIIGNYKIGDYSSVPLIPDLTHPGNPLGNGNPFTIEENSPIPSSSIKKGSLFNTGSIGDFFDKTSGRETTQNTTNAGVIASNKDVISAINKLVSSLSGEGLKLHPDTVSAVGKSAGQATAAGVQSGINN